MVDVRDRLCPFKGQRLDRPQFEGLFRLVGVAPVTAQLGFELLDSPGTHRRLLQVLCVRDGAGRAIFPVPDRLPQSNGLAHAVLDLVGVAPGMAL